MYAYPMVLMKVALLQLDPLVGDLAGNLRQLRTAAEDAAAAGARLLLGTDLGIIGYPPRDLLLRAGSPKRAKRRSPPSPPPSRPNWRR